jgi:hypothetical protein
MALMGSRRRRSLFDGLVILHRFMALSVTTCITTVWVALDPFDGVCVVIVLEPVKVVDDRKGKEHYDLPFSLYDYQDIVFAPQ